ncbi:MAG: TadE/TadG family protein [Rhizobiales bacterium]|nr:TadE/TadG family protein [Hyphomicrobiales bacterium]
MSGTSTSGTSIREQVSNSVARFGRDRGGSIAPIFAIALLPMLGFVGAAVDYTRANAARSSMQAAMDSAALMVSKDANAANPPMTASEITAAAQKYFNALYHNTDAQNVEIGAVYTPYSNGVPATVHLTGSGAVKTDFMRVAGFPELDFKTASTATWGNTKLRVAMALDVTGSMSSAGKLDAMKKAAKGLIDTLKASANATGDVYISIVPFNTMVNVGNSNSTAAWLDWENGSAGTNFSRYSNFGSCSKSSLSTKSACTAAGKKWTASNVSKWSGCVTDRTQSYDTTKDAPDSGTPGTLYLAQNYTQSVSSGMCPSSLLPMTSAFDSKESDSSTDDTTLKGKINNLTATGATNQAIAMQMAWMMLQPTAPFITPAKDSKYKYTDAIILLSDGLNTQDRWYGNGSDWSSQVDTRQAQLCNNIKDPTNGTTQIYTIQVNTDGDPISTVLKNCATDGNFFPTSSASGIASAFGQIGASLAKLRIAQ